MLIVRKAAHRPIYVRRWYSFKNRLFEWALCKFDGPGTNSLSRPTFPLMPSLPRAQETLFFQNAAGKLFHHPAGFVRMAWNADRLPAEVIKAYYEQALTLMLTTGADKILSHHGQRAPLPGPVQQWLTENWIPRAISQARAYYCAIVEGADPMHRLSTQSVVSAAPVGMVFKRFSALDEAERWLLTGK